MNHQARRVIHDLDETIILKQPDFTFCCCVKRILRILWLCWLQNVAIRQETARTNVSISPDAALTSQGWAQSMIGTL